MVLLEEELSYKVRGCIYKVANKYGKGLKEKVYQNVLTEELKIANLKTEEQKRINIHSFDTGKIVGVYIPDFLIEDKIIIEIKASNFITNQDIDQQRSYLRISIYEIAYLVNFCANPLFIKRNIYTNDKKPFISKIIKQA